MRGKVRESPGDGCSFGRLRASSRLVGRPSVPEQSVELCSTGQPRAAVPTRWTLHCLRRAEAAALVEFAVSLPLLIVLVVGIFDFGAAFNMKQELNNAMREGARFGAAQPTNDLYNSGVPPSVNAIRSVVDAYLQAAKINDCGLAGASGSSPSSMTWQYNANGCASQLQLTISRGLSQTEIVGGNQVNLLCTQVSISYPYQWHFNNVLQVLIPGAKLNLPLTITTQATAVNMD